MKLFTQDSNQNRTFVKEVFSFVGATNAVVAHTYRGTWILVAGDKEFVFTAAVGDEWMEIPRTPFERCKRVGIVVAMLIA